jgi:hypothetical protein
MGPTPVDEQLHDLVSEGYWTVQNLRSIPDTKENSSRLINMLRDYNINVSEAKSRRDILQQLVVIASNNDVAAGAIDQVIGKYISSFNKTSDISDELLALQLQYG